MSYVNENSTKPIFIEIYFNDNKIGSATGFQIHYGNTKYLVTNWHVVSGRNFITKKCISNQQTIPNKLILKYKKYLDNSEFEWSDKTIELYDNIGEKIWYEHPKYKNDVDVVLIPLEGHLQYLDYRECFNVNSNYNLFVTEPVFVLGYPLGYIVKNKYEPHAVWTSGTVASDLSLNLEINGKEIPAFLIDSKTRKGQSGSPVIYYSSSGLDLHYRNKIGDEGFVHWGCPFMQEIGIYSGRISEDSDLGYVWKWTTIKEILDSIKQ